MVTSNEYNAPQRRLALLVDCDNADAHFLSAVLDEAKVFGDVIVRRGYGDWSTPHLKGWKEQFEKHAFRPIQQYRVKSKNSSDIALVLDAMDILHSNTVDGFCLYTGDSDFTLLVTRIREAGLYVVGFGKQENASQTLINAFDRFIFTENLVKDDTKKPKAKPKQAKDTKLTTLLTNVYNSRIGDDEAMLLAVFGIALHKRDPGFDHRTYGFSSLSALVKAHGFTLKSREGHYWISK